MQVQAAGTGHMKRIQEVDTRTGYFERIPGCNIGKVY
jgi:hypothetical protein